MDDDEAVSGGPHYCVTSQHNGTTAICNLPLSRQVVLPSFAALPASCVRLVDLRCAICITGRPKDIEAGNELYISYNVLENGMSPLNVRITLGHSNNALHSMLLVDCCGALRDANRHC